MYCIPINTHSTILDLVSTSELKQQKKAVKLCLLSTYLLEIFHFQRTKNIDWNKKKNGK